MSEAQAQWIRGSSEILFLAWMTLIGALVGAILGTVS
jgi:hypothetical protein